MKYVQECFIHSYMGTVVFGELQNINFEQIIGKDNKKLAKIAL